MPGVRYRFRTASGVPVVTAPAEIDITTAGHLRAALLDAAAAGHGTVVVDLAGTRFCDSAGLNLLVRAHKRARAEGGGLRLVIPAEGVVLRVFTVTGIDRVIPRFASLEEALARVPAPASRPPRPGRPAQAPGVPAGPSAEAWKRGLAADVRACAQCGVVFVPQREHARFCTPGCRAAWNREHLGDPAVEASALAWSITAMSETTGRLAVTRPGDRPRALAAIGEAVWWVTMVDATLVRHHRGVYDVVLAASGAAQRRLTEQTLAGLRFVRNRIGPDAGLDGLIHPEGAGYGRVTGWTWKPAPEPALDHLQPRGQAWEMARYRAYQAGLAGHTVGETFRRAVTFLTRTSASTAPATIVAASTRR